MLLGSLFEIIFSLLHLEKWKKKFRFFLLHANFKNIINNFEKKKINNLNLMIIL